MAGCKRALECGIISIREAVSIMMDLMEQLEADPAYIPDKHRKEVLRLERKALMMVYDGSRCFEKE